MPQAKVDVAGKKCRWSIQRTEYALMHDTDAKMTITHSFIPVNKGSHCQSSVGHRHCEFVWVCYKTFHLINAFKQGKPFNGMCFWEITDRLKIFNVLKLDPYTAYTIEQHGFIKTFHFKLTVAGFLYGTLWVSLCGCHATAWLALCSLQKDNRTVFIRPSSLYPIKWKLVGLVVLITAFIYLFIS